MSMHQLNNTRNVYNFLDFLGDLGGCLDALIYLGTFLVWILTGDGLNNFIVSQISKYDEQDEP